MIYFQDISPTFKIDELTKFLADRITTKTKVLILTEDPEIVMDQFKASWANSSVHLAAERDNQDDIRYKAILADIISIMHQSSVGLVTDNSSYSFNFARPSSLGKGINRDCTILVACDQKSFKAANSLLAGIKTDFKLFATLGIANPESSKSIGLTKVESARKQFRKSLKEMQAIITTLKKNQDNNLQKQLELHISKLIEYRTICGRASTSRGFDSDSLIDLKILIARWSSNDLHDSDHQLFDSSRVTLRV